MLIILPNYFSGNNMYIFPGLGFGAVIADATRVTDGMISAAARWQNLSLPPSCLPHFFAVNL
jgi:malic enzyme